MSENNTPLNTAALIRFRVWDGTCVAETYESRIQSAGIAATVAAYRMKLSTRNNRELVRVKNNCASFPDVIRDVEISNPLHTSVDGLAATVTAH